MKVAGVISEENNRFLPPSIQLAQQKESCFYKILRKLKLKYIYGSLPEFLKVLFIKRMTSLLLFATDDTRQIFTLKFTPVRDFRLWEKGRVRLEANEA